MFGQNFDQIGILGCVIKIFFYPLIFLNKLSYLGHSCESFDYLIYLWDKTWSFFIQSHDVYKFYLPPKYAGLVHGTNVKF